MVWPPDHNWLNCLGLSTKNSLWSRGFGSHRSSVIWSARNMFAEKTLHIKNFNGYSYEIFLNLIWQKKVIRFYSAAWLWAHLGPFRPPNWTRFWKFYSKYYFPRFAPSIRHSNIDVHAKIPPHNNRNVCPHDVEYLRFERNLLQQ